MSTNITTAFKSGDGVIVSPQVVSTTDNAGNSIAVTLPHVTRVLAVHAFSTVAGTFDIGDKNGSKIKFQVAASGTADIYMGDICRAPAGALQISMGEVGVKCEGTVSVSTPDAGGVTLVLG